MTTVIRVFLVFACIFFINHAAIAKDSRYTITKIPVDESGDNATQARLEAIKAAERIGFKQLLQEIVPKERLYSLPEYSSAQITSLVQSFSVRNEKISGNRYRANVTISFNPEYVRNFLKNSGIAIIEDKSRSILVLPLLHKEEHSYLWGNDNLWKKRWDRYAGKQITLNFILPIGDLEDIEHISVENLANTPIDALQAMAKKYNAKEIVIAEASYNQPKNRVQGFLNVQVRHIKDGTAEELKHATYLMHIDDNFDDLLGEAVKDIALKIQNNWEDLAIAASSNTTKNLRVLVPYRDIIEWVEIEKNLRNVTGISKLSIKEMTAHNVVIQFKSKYALADLKPLLEENGLALFSRHNHLILTQKHMF